MAAPARDYEGASGLMMWELRLLPFWFALCTDIS